MASFSQLSGLANSADPADLFAGLYDVVEAHFADMFLEPQKVRGWLKQDAAEIATVEAATLSGALNGATADARVGAAPEAAREALLLLAGLDQALAHASPWTASTRSRALAAIRARFRATGRMNEQTDGAVLPRRTRPGRHANAPERLANALYNAVRVAQSDWQQVDLTVVPAGLDFSAADLAGGLTVACAPVLEDVDEMSLASTADATYMIEPLDTPALRTRLADVLHNLDISGAQLAVLPELSLTCDLLDYWRDLVVRVPRAPGSRLHWILVGTGAFAAGSGQKPYNQAHLMDRDSGLSLLKQEKRAGFTMPPTLISEWQLETALGVNQLDEDITLGGKLRLLESRAGRFAILLCEDLARTAQQAPLAISVNASRILVPVFSDLLTEYYWEHQGARQLATEIGSDIIVSNSRVVANSRGLLGSSFTSKTGTAIRVSPRGYSVKGSMNASEPVVFPEL